MTQRITEHDLATAVARLKEKVLNEMGSRGAAPARPAQATKPAKTWPADPATIKAFQTAAGLKADGLIGQKTFAALKAQGYVPPAGFTPVANKAPAAQATKPADQATMAPAPAGPTGAPNPSDAVEKAKQGIAAGTPTPAAAPAADNGLSQNAPGVAPAVAAAQGAAAPATAAPATAAPGTAPVIPGVNASATTPAPAAAAPAAAAKPAGAPNPWEGKDPAKAAAWAALSPEDQKWIGQADPTDKFILARSPSNGGFLGSLGFGKKKAAPAAAPAPAAPAPAAPPSVQGTAAGFAPNYSLTPPADQKFGGGRNAATTMGEGAGYDELQRILSIVQHR